MKPRSFGLRLLAVFAKSGLLMPVFEFLFALYQRPEGLARPEGQEDWTPLQLAAAAQAAQSRWGLYGVVWLFGLAAASLGLLLRSREEVRGGEGFSVWKLLGVLSVLGLLCGAADWSFAGLGLSVPFLCAAAAILLLGVWGWLGAVQDPVAVLSPPAMIVSFSLSIICVLVTGIMSFFNKEPSPLNTGAMVAALAVPAIVSIYILAVGKIDYDLENSGAGLNKSAPAVRRYNARAALVSMLAALVIGFACFGGMNWVVTKTAGLVGDGAYAVLSGMVRNRVIGKYTQNRTETGTESMSVVPQEEPEPSSGPAESAAVITGLFLLLTLVSRPFWPLIVSGLGGLFRRRGERVRRVAELYYLETVEQLTPSETRSLFSRLPAQDSLRQALRRYAALREPEEKVRGALSLLRLIARRQSIPVQPGDTARQTVGRFVERLDPGLLDGYARSYERVRYGGFSASSADGEQADALVRAAKDLPLPEK